jgi:hypothetical protein
MRRPKLEELAELCGVGRVCLYPTLVLGGLRGFRLRGSGGYLRGDVGLGWNIGGYEFFISSFVFIWRR